MVLILLTLVELIPHCQDVNIFISIFDIAIVEHGELVEKLLSCLLIFFGQRWLSLIEVVAILKLGRNCWPAHLLYHVVH